jgi:hypothetical protein
MSYNKFQVNSLKIQDFSTKGELAKIQYLQHIKDTIKKEDRTILCKESLNGEFCDAHLYISETPDTTNLIDGIRKLCLKTLPSSAPHADFCENKIETKKSKPKTSHPRVKKDKQVGSEFFFGKGKKSMDNDSVSSKRIIYSV